LKSVCAVAVFGLAAKSRGARLDVEGDDDLVDDLGGLAVAAHPG
jgi:hypothetical protein